MNNTALSILPTLSLTKLATWLNNNLNQNIHHHLNQKQQQQLKQTWQNIQSPNSNTQTDKERLETNWLMQLFNQLFIGQNVILIRGNQEPEYIPAQNNQPARIEFAHGFFSSALHEISHWCIAGKHRRTLTDFGYWYAPDGRTQRQQQAFEQVEIKPQSIEYLLTQACNKPFRVSQDNLFADFDTNQSTFTQDVQQQTANYLTNPNTLPKDSQLLLNALLNLCHTTNKST